MKPNTTVILLLLLLLLTAPVGIAAAISGTWIWEPAGDESVVGSYEVQISYDNMRTWETWSDSVSPTPVDGFIRFPYSSPRPLGYYIRVRGIGHQGQTGPFSEVSYLGYEPVGWDLNHDGIVDILDLVDVSRAFGKRGRKLVADVNEDGSVDIVDLVMVSAHFGESVAVVLAAPQHPISQNVTQLERWLREARIADDGSGIYRQGVAMLEYLLRSVIPDRTSLLSNYPNPFNPETWIPYELSESAEVVLTIYDVPGRIVRRFDLGHQEAGIYHAPERAIHWDGRNHNGEAVASGRYFYTLRAGQYISTRTMVILR